MKWTKILPIIGIAIFIFLLTRIDLHKFVAIVKTANPLFLGLAVLLTLIQVLLQTYKWDVLLKLQGMEVHYTQLVKLQLKSAFYGSITPGRVGSFSKIPHLKQITNYSLSICAPSVIIDRFLDMITVLVMAVIGAGLILTSNTYVIYEVGILTFILIIGFFILLDKKLMKKFMNLFFKIFIIKKLKTFVDESFEDFYKNIPTKKHLIYPFILSVLAWVLTYSISYAIALAIHVQIPYLAFIFLFPIATIVGMIPITLAGIGTREVALIGLLSIYGVTPEQAIAISLLGFIFSSMIPSLLGGIYSIKDDTNVH